MYRYIYTIIDIIPYNLYKYNICTNKPKKNLFNTYKGVYYSHERTKLQNWINNSDYWN